MLSMIIDSIVAQVYCVVWCPDFKSIGSTIENGVHLLLPIILPLIALLARHLMSRAVCYVLAMSLIFMNILKQ